MSDSLPNLSSFGESKEQLGEKNNRILIFSVEKDSRLLLTTLLQIWDYKTEEASDPENALSIVKKLKPNLILIDAVRSYETNLENIRRFRKNKFCKNVPIILLSGFSQPEFRRLSIATGADDFFVKPVDFDLLQVCLEKNIEKYSGKLF